MKSSIRKCYICHDVIFNENDYGKSTDANELKLKNLKDTVSEMPIEPEKEESEQEINEQPEPPRCFQRESRPPVHCSIDDLPIHLM